MKNVIASNISELLAEIRQCRICEGNIPGPRPVLRASASARVLIIGQAPGSRVHASGIPWDDPSGRRLRQWMNMDEAVFYDDSKIAIIPMGFCYPGKGTSGDLPPRPECAKTWHQALLTNLPNIECTLLIGNYAQNHYLNNKYKTLTERVANWRRYAPASFVLPHPSPRNQIWLKKNPWFEKDAVPALQTALKTIL